MVDAHHLDAAGGVGQAGGDVAAVAGDHGVQRGGVDEVDEEAAITGGRRIAVAGVEGQAEQPLFTRAGHRDAEKGAGHAALHNLDEPAFFHHEQPPVGQRRSGKERLAQAAGDEPGAQGLGAGAGGQGHQRQSG